MSVDPLSVRNRLLSGLPTDVLGAVSRDMDRVEVPLRTVLYAADATIAAVHFPEAGIVSMIAMLEDGDASEVGLIGREGMTGLPVLLGDGRSPLESLVQSGLVALRIESEAFRRAVATLAPLRNVLLRYALAFQSQVTMTAACNSRHPIEQRLARWLLMAHDRTEGDTFPMTHEFLSLMLGVRRAGVTVAAGALQRAGLIAYEAGRITVTDRAGLEAAACECHSTVRREFGRLLGRDVETG